MAEPIGSGTALISPSDPNCIVKYRSTAAWTCNRSRAPNGQSLGPVGLCFEAILDHGSVIYYARSTTQLVEGVVGGISEAAERRRLAMDTSKSPVIQPLLRLTNKTTSWASLNSIHTSSVNESVENSCEISENLPSFFRGCDDFFQKTVVYENGLRFIRGTCGSETLHERNFDSLESNQPTYSNSCDSGMFVDMDKRSDRTIDADPSAWSDLGIDVNQEEPAYSVPSSVRPLEIESTILKTSDFESPSDDIFDSEIKQNPIYMELEPPKSFTDFSAAFSGPQSVPFVDPPKTFKEPQTTPLVKGTVVKKVSKYKSSAEKRMIMCVEKTNREVFEKPCPIRMVYRRQSQRRLQSRKRVERVVPRLTQLCVQVLISEK
ncbi:hypothetical protein J6590_017200 [Homalodisca vitripennis]|nr:hypothetical protein J6590_017200 [Homalodisca vitripennis]